MNYKPFNVECISLTDDVQKAWEMSHAFENCETVDSTSLLKMQLPVSGFRRYNLQIDSSILFRDLMLTLRPCICWAQSMRSFVYTEETVKLSDECLQLVKGDELRDILQSSLLNVIKKAQSGEPIDTIKQQLPMMTSVRFNIIVSHRHLVNWLYAIKLHIPGIFNVVKDHFFKACNFTEELFNESKKIDIWNYVALTPNEIIRGKSTSGSNLLDMHVIFTEVQCNLMAQFIRQSQSVVKNGLYNLCEQDLGFAVLMKCNDPIKCGAYLTIDSLQYLLSKRTCWFAQFDDANKSSWAHLLGSAVENMAVDEFLANLPCGGNGCNCDIKQDMINKVKGGDVNPPCPLFVENPEMIKIRKEYYKKESAITRKWEEVCNSIFLNPNNEYAQMYFGGDNGTEHETVDK